MTPPLAQRPTDGVQWVVEGQLYLLSGHGNNERTGWTNLSNFYVANLCFQLFVNADEDFENLFSILDEFRFLPP